MESVCWIFCDKFLVQFRNLYILLVRGCAKCATLDESFFSVHQCMGAMATAANIISGLLVGFTNNAFFSGICATIAIIQELIIIAIVHVLSHQMLLVFKEFEVSFGTSFSVQRRKLWIIRIAATVLILADIINSIVPDDSDFHYLENPRPVKPFVPEEFDATPTIGQLLAIAAHIAMLYAMRRPSESPNQTNNNMVKLDRASEHFSKISIVERV